jgi:hypothetical protein
MNVEGSMHAYQNLAAAVAAAAAITTTSSGNER